MGRRVGKEVAIVWRRGPATASGRRLEIVANSMRIGAGKTAEDMGPAAAGWHEVQRSDRHHLLLRRKTRCNRVCGEAAED